jgi:uncharacterized protein (TIGR02145 family)
MATNGDSTPLGLTVLNHEAGKPEVYIGQTATLDVRLVNSGGTDLPITAKTQARLSVYFPSFYAKADIRKMKPDLSSMPGWTSNPQDDSLELDYQGADTVWPAGQAFAFSIADVGCSATSPVTDQTAEIAPDGINVRSPQVEAPLVLIEAPKPGDASLPDTLHMSLENQGVVFVSDANDPLANQLTLYITNTGDAPIYNDKDHMRPTSPVPKIEVSFIYGGTSGALAPAGKKEGGSLGSAWQITAATTDLSAGGWVAGTPSTTDSGPVWTFTPSDNNTTLLTAGTQRSVAFTFSNIISFLVPGLTQMVVHCKDFVQSSARKYNSAVFVLDIVKQSPPATRGLVSFHSPMPFHEVNSPSQTVTIPLRWTMTDVNSVTLLSSQPGVGAIYIPYGSPPPALAYGKRDITVSGITDTTTLLLALQAFDGARGYLNSLQFAAHIQANMFIDALGAVYPVVLIGGKYWMAADLALNADHGSSPGKYGRYYTAAAAVQPAPGRGWRLPSLADWQSLLAVYANPQAAYTALIAGGSSGFDAQLSGFLDQDGNSTSELESGYYWSSTPGDGGTRLLATFSGTSKSMILANNFDPACSLSVRYVRDAQ